VAGARFLGAITTEDVPAFAVLEGWAAIMPGREVPSRMRPGIFSLESLADHRRYSQAIPVTSNLAFHPDPIP
jgi:hypothetical protein